MPRVFFVSARVLCARVLASTLIIVAVSLGVLIGNMGLICIGTMMIDVIANSAIASASYASNGWALRFQLPL
eukprot:9162120-Pyramimonas_sp.AAC.1